MIFLSAGFLAYPITLASLISLLKAAHPLTLSLALVVICGILYYYVLSIVAFFHFVITDSIAKPFNHFYVTNMFFMTIGLAIAQFLFLIVFYVFDSWKSSSLALSVTIHLIFSYTLLVFMFFWSRRLESVMPKQEEGSDAVVADEEAARKEPLPAEKTETN